MGQKYVGVGKKIKTLKYVWGVGEKIKICSVAVDKFFHSASTLRISFGIALIIGMVKSS